jgi:hypothetical protein
MLFSSLRRLVLVIRELFGYIPNREWIRAQLSRATALDRARAQAAIGETERCLRLRAAGGYCGRFAAPVR